MRPINGCSVSQFSRGVCSIRQKWLKQTNSWTEWRDAWSPQTWIYYSHDEQNEQKTLIKPARYQGTIVLLCGLCHRQPNPFLMDKLAESRYIVEFDFKFQPPSCRVTKTFRSWHFYLACRSSSCHPRTTKSARDIRNFIHSVCNLRGQVDERMNVLQRS